MEDDINAISVWWQHVEPDPIHRGSVHKTLELWFSSFVPNSTGCLRGSYGDVLAARQMTDRLPNRQLAESIHAGQMVGCCCSSLTERTRSFQNGDFQLCNNRYVVNLLPSQSDIEVAVTHFLCTTTAGTVSNPCSIIRPRAFSHQVAPAGSLYLCNEMFSSSQFLWSALMFKCSNH